MEICEKCQTVLMVRGGQYSTENGEIFYTQEKYCNNPACDNHNKTVDIIKHKLN